MPTITQENMMHPILECSPEFLPIWQKFKSDWEDDETTAEEGFPLYLVLNDLARYTARLHSENRLQDLRTLFLVIERWYLEGNHYVQEAATVGFLEDLQNPNIVGNIDTECFVQYMGGKTKEFWYKVRNFWDKGKIITSD
jgi:hypothetical protein